MSKTEALRIRRGTKSLRSQKAQAGAIIELTNSSESDDEFNEIPTDGKNANQQVNKKLNLKSNLIIK